MIEIDPKLCNVVSKLLLFKIGRIDFILVKTCDFLDGKCAVNIVASSISFVSKSVGGIVFFVVQLQKVQTVQHF